MPILHLLGMKGEQNTTPKKSYQEKWWRSIQSELLAGNDTWWMTGKLSLNITVAWLQRLKCAVCKEKKKNVDKCMPAHRKYKKRSSKYRCEWQADCEWIGLSVGLNTRQPAQFTMEDFLSVACGGLFWPEATLDGPVQLMQLTVLYSYWLVFTYSR